MFTSLASLAVAAAAALAPPALRVAIEGDPALVDFVRARFLAAGIVVVTEPAAADVRVRVRALDVGRIRVVVEDRRGPVADRLVTESDPADARVAVWLVARDALDRVDLTAPSRVDTPAVPAPVAVDVLLDVAPDPMLGARSFFPVGAEMSARFTLAPRVQIVADVGYSAELASDASLHVLAVRVGAEAVSDTNPDAVAFAAGARVSTTPSLAVAKNKNGLASGLGVGASVGGYGRALFPLGVVLGAHASAVLEAGVEARLVREAVLADAGTREEASFAAPIAAGVEVRF